MYCVRILIALIMLIICAVSDIRTGYIDVKVVYAAVAVYMLSAIILYSYSDCDMGKMFLRFAAGYMLIKALFVYDGIGEGDLYMVAALLVIAGVRIAVVTLAAAFVMSGIYALFLICIKKARGDYGFPFAPFILAGFIAGCTGTLL